MFHGSGVYTLTNGDSYSGQFHENEMHGFGSFVVAGGERVSGRFEKGKLVEREADGSNGLSQDVCDMKDRSDFLAVTSHSESLAATAAAADAAADASAAAAADAAGSADSSVHVTHDGRPTAAQRHSSAVAAAAAAVPHYCSLPHAFTVPQIHPSITSDHVSSSLPPRGSLVAAGCTTPPPNSTFNVIALNPF